MEININRKTFYNMKHKIYVKNIPIYHSYKRVMVMIYSWLNSTHKIFNDRIDFVALSKNSRGCPWWYGNLFCPKTSGREWQVVVGSRGRSRQGPHSSHCYFVLPKHIHIICPYNHGYFAFPIQNVSAYSDSSHGYLAFSIHTHIQRIWVAACPINNLWCPLCVEVETHSQAV